MDYKKNIIETIGNTPLVKLNKVNDTEALVLAKVETFNPGHSIKDRMALKMVEDAEKDGRLKPGGTIIEGTSGNTGMGLALAAIQKGYKCIFVLADKQSKEKMDILRAVGAHVEVCPTDVEPDDPRSYYSVSRRLSEEIPNAWYVNQYDNPSNSVAHYESTGPEIWEQTDGKVDGFVCASGTGGTIGGVSKFLKEKNKDVKIYLSDPTGSALYNYITNGELKAEGGSITEGIGSSRVTKNFAEAKIDGAFSISDEESLPILYDLIQNEGLSLGTSCGVNIAGAIRLGKELGPGKTIVTILCDKSDKYNSKMFNKSFLKEKNLPIPSWL